MPVELDQEQQFKPKDSSHSEPHSHDKYLTDKAVTLPNRFSPRPSEWSTSQREMVLLITRIIAFMVAIYGNWIMATQRTEQTGLATGLPILFLAFLIWIIGDIYIGLLQRRLPPELHVEVVFESPDLTFDSSKQRFEFWSITLKLICIMLAFTTSMITLSATSSNHFTLPGVVMWTVSVVLWIAVFAPPQWNIRTLVTSIRTIRLPNGWTFLTLIGIMGIALLFRFTDLNTIPSEMTTDHVEKILDSQHILTGNTQVFFTNNGGREPIQFYLMALISRIPGLGMNFFTLKVLTAIEGLICIPVLWWVGREIIGKDEPQLANTVGLLLAALVAVSYWHTVLSRLGLRIVLTVIVTGLLMIFLTRALRHNQRGDYIKAGLVLGGGVYAYQAARMLPVVVVAGVVLTIVFSLFRSSQRRQIKSYITNAIVLVIITFAVFVPMAGFVSAFPDDFWRRTSGRILGDETEQVFGQADTVVSTNNIAPNERTSIFQQNLAILMSNIRNALLMYNWKGDGGWISAAPNYPEMDIVTGSLLIIGLGAWGLRMVKRRNATDWLVPAVLFIMLLPSAFSIAHPMENPSATRASGSLPEAYLFAAFPLALMWLEFRRLFPSRWGTVAGASLVGIVIFASANANWNTYFVDFNQSYIASSPGSYTEAGKFLREFVDNGGSLGNAFVIYYPYWWDARAVGIEAGVTDFLNGIAPREDVPIFIKLRAQQQGKYQIDPNKDLLFFYNPVDTSTQIELQKWFPNGVNQLIHSYKPNGNFNIYRVPKLGSQGLLDFETQFGTSSQH